MSRLPLFPLPIVLFPGALLPLHIFELRYQQLLTDCVAGDHRFGILPPGSDETPPPAGTIGSVAQVRAIRPLEEGRSNIVVSGDWRFTLDRVVDSDTLYWVGEVTRLDDLPDVQVPAGVDLDALRVLASRYAEGVATLHDAPNEPNFVEDVGRFTFQVASLLDWDESAKQRFLAIRSVTERVTRLLQTLPGQLESIEARARVHRRAKTNGAGPHEHAG